jgi:hypothetical protein
MVLDRTVWENVAYGLKLRKAAGIEAIVDDCLEQVGIASFLTKRKHQLIWRRNTTSCLNDIGAGQTCAGRAYRQPGSIQYQCDRTGVLQIIRLSNDHGRHPNIFRLVAWLTGLLSCWMEKSLKQVKHPSSLIIPQIAYPVICQRRYGLLI